jgi:hypothetical protein
MDCGKMQEAQPLRAMQLVQMFCKPIMLPFLDMFLGSPQLA